MMWSPNNGCSVLRVPGPSKGAFYGVKPQSHLLKMGSRQLRSSFPASLPRPNFFPKVSRFIKNKICEDIFIIQNNILSLLIYTQALCRVILFFVLFVLSFF